jgi:transcriptional regulator NrdR family protein
MIIHVILLNLLPKSLLIASISMNIQKIIAEANKTKDAIGIMVLKLLRSISSVAIIRIDS